MNRIELLRDVFVWAYERSCQQYVAVQQHLVPPDTFRLRYRLQLKEVVAAIVRSNKPAAASSVLAFMPETVAEADRERFVELLVAEFNSLHAGNVVRFGLRPLEFAIWQENNRESAG